MSQTSTRTSIQKSCILLPYFGGGHGAHLHYRALRREVQGVLQLEHGKDTVDAARCLLVAQALKVEPAVEVLVFIDSDVSFTRADYERLVESCLETKSIVGVPYITKTLDGTQRLAHVVGLLTDLRLFYERGGLYPAPYLGMGFTAIHRSVIETVIAESPGMQERVLFGGDAPELAHPLFMPMILDGQYLHEDYAFCERARGVGIQPLMETRPSGVRHHGEHGYRVEDLGLVSAHHPELVMHVLPPIQKLPEEPVDKPEP